MEVIVGDVAIAVNGQPVTQIAGEVENQSAVIGQRA